ncbi:MAG: bifunctional phosphopantothenoylcysteine decarboxylase/phosphopantothenate--cysteine ligase CoaBC [Kiritimatiellae bacterium]|nr:bifunctional phosphopantothenoylcysteine decarboxylase/phosphopantothenate--cysteine ligase CoaBC [Kiritimatiellia bacterium]
MRRIVLGVTGSIAAYKAVELLRLLVKNGDDVRVVMTPAAREFVAPLTFQTLSRNPVESEMFARTEAWKPDHVSLADFADLAVVAPATANTIAKMRAGIADNLLASTLLATRAPVFIAPAMNEGMWLNAATMENIEVLKRRGVSVIEPAEGFLACGTSGKGRMAEPEEIFEALSR